MLRTKPEVYKDKIEVSLDGRQIFYLFFGGSVIVGLVFVLGVMVGRRVEARGHIDRARTSAVTDPLAALDRLEGARGLSYQGTLTGKDGAPAEVDETIAKMAAAKAEAKPAPEAKPSEPKPAEAKPEPAKVEKKEPAKGEPKESEKVEQKAAPKTEQAPKADETAKSGPVTKPDSEPEPRYTLQLSSFQDKTEAEQFLAKVKSSGYSATLTEADVSGKGTFYRIRLGTYRSLQAANEAKADYDSASGKSASIMKL